MLKANAKSEIESEGAMTQMISEELLDKNVEVYKSIFARRSEKIRGIAKMFLYADMPSTLAKFEQIHVDALANKKSPSVGELTVAFHEQIIDVIAPFVAYDAAAGLILARDLTGEWDVLYDVGDLEVEDVSVAIATMFKDVFTELDTASTRAAKGLISAITIGVNANTPALQFADMLLTATGVVESDSPRNDRPPMYISSQSVSEFVRTRKFTKRVKEVDELIESICDNDQAVVDRVLDRLALSLVFDTTIRRKYPTILFFHGRGGSGKSTLIDLVRRAFGCDELTTAIKLSKFKDFELSKLPRKLFVYDSEASNGFIDADASDNLKSVATLDTISVNPKYRQPYDLRSSALIVAAGNKIPHSADKSTGWLRRLELVEVDNLLVKPDAWFIELLSDDAALYMLEILLGRALDILKRGEIAPLPEALSDAKDEYILANDSVALWIADESIDVAKECVYERPKDIYAKYVEWCDATDETKCAPTKFRARLCRLGDLTIKAVQVTEQLNARLLTDLQLDPERMRRGMTVRVFAPVAKPSDSDDTVKPSLSKPSLSKSSTKPSKTSRKSSTRPKQSKPRKRKS